MARPNALIRLLLGAVLAVMGVLALAPSADAAHHLVRIKQVYAGAGTATEFVVLQLTAPGENQFTAFGGSELRFYDTPGESGSEPLDANPANDESQRTVLVATPDAETEFDVQADFEMDDSNFLEDDGGAVCFQSLYVVFGTVDCVGWGTGTALSNPPSGMGTLEAAIPAGSMLERSIAANCSTFFESGDDTNQSAVDFAPVPITAGAFIPRNNLAAITETTCSAPPPGGGATTPTSPPATKKKKCKKGRKLKKGKCVKKKRKK